MIAIDRITVDAGSLAPEDARRFAELLGAELGRLAAVRGSVPSVSGPVRVRVTSGAGVGVTQLAMRAAAEVVAALWKAGAS